LVYLIAIFQHFANTHLAKAKDV